MGVGDQRHPAAALFSGKTWYPFYRTVMDDVEHLAPTGAQLSNTEYRVAIPTH